MPRGIYIRTPEMQSGKFKHKPQQGFQKGNQLGKLTKGKPRLNQRGKKNTIEHNLKVSKNHSHYWLGKKKPPMSENTRRKIRDANLGERSHFYKGGITKENELVRKGIEFRLWREAVFARDNWACQKYGYRGEKGFGCRVVLHPHHIQNFAEFPELRFAIDNGITLSKQAHNEFHKKYGYKNNTKEQIIEFLK